MWMRALPWAVGGVLAACVLGFVIVVMATPEGCHSPVERTRTDAQTIRSAVELYLAQNPGGDCPGVIDLLEEHMINGNTNTEDQWRREFAIDCGGEDPMVMSAGPDGVLGNTDDIR